MARGLLMHGGANPASVTLLQRVLFESPWRVVALLLRAFYGFKVEGEEHVPKHGPYIVLNNEYSPIAFLLSGWFDIRVLRSTFGERVPVISFLREELFEFSFFRNALDDNAPGYYAGLKPITAGRQALSLLEAYRVLEQGGIVMLNPEGDMPWDGRPLPLGHALAWLALHAGAPIVPAAVSIGAYDIWPRWQTRMNFSGHVEMKVGEPIVLCDRPQARFSDQELAAAEGRIRDTFNKLIYGPGSIPAWAGSPRRGSASLDALPTIDHSGTIKKREAEFNARPAIGRGIGVLLWQCPVCQTNDGLVPDRRLLGDRRIRCAACATVWSVKHIPGKDWRLQVVEGPADLVGLEMALSMWYDEMRKGFRPVPLAAGEPSLEDAEDLYLVADGVTLTPRRPNPIYNGWKEREAPKVQATGKLPGRGDWESLGRGRLLLTNKRLVWQGPGRDVDFLWPEIASASLWMFNTLALQYGFSPYRIELGKENGLKWLAHVGRQAIEASEGTGRKPLILPS